MSDFNIMPYNGDTTQNVNTLGATTINLFHNGNSTCQTLNIGGICGSMNLVSTPFNYTITNMTWDGTTCHAYFTPADTIINGATIYGVTTNVNPAGSWSTARATLLTSSAGHISFAHGDTCTYVSDGTLIQYQQLVIGACTGYDDSYCNLNNYTIALQNARTLLDNANLSSIFPTTTTTTIGTLCTTLNLGATSGTISLRNTKISLPNATSLTCGAGLANIFVGNTGSCNLLTGMVSNTLTIGGSGSTLALNSTTISCANATSLTSGVSTLTLFASPTTISLGGGTSTILNLGKTQANSSSRSNVNTTAGYVTCLAPIALPNLNSSNWTNTAIMGCGTQNPSITCTGALTTAQTFLNFIKNSNGTITMWWNDFSFTATATAQLNCPITAELSPAITTVRHNFLVSISAGAYTSATFTITSTTVAFASNTGGTAFTNGTAYVLGGNSYTYPCPSTAWGY